MTHGQSLGSMESTSHDHDWGHPLLAILALLVLLVKVFLWEGVAELLDDALPHLGHSEVSDRLPGVHALLQTQHLREQGVQWTAETFAGRHIPRFLVTHTAESNTSVVDLVVLLLQPVESSVSFGVLQTFPVLLSATLVLEELDRLTFSFLVGVLLVRIVRLFPSLDGVSQVLLEEQVVSGSVGHSELLVHVGVTEVELGIHEHAAEVFVCTEGTAHRTN